MVKGAQKIYLNLWNVDIFSIWAQQVRQWDIQVCCCKQPTSQAVSEL